MWHSTRDDLMLGELKQSEQPVSGEYALMERSREFTLFPWRPVIENALGREIPTEWFLQDIRD